jgi:hypothetical protein
LDTLYFHAGTDIALHVHVFRRQTISGALVCFARRAAACPVGWTGSLLSWSWRLGTSRSCRISWPAHLELCLLFTKLNGSLGCEPRSAHDVPASLEPPEGIAVETSMSTDLPSPAADLAEILRSDLGVVPLPFQMKLWLAHLSRAEAEVGEVQSDEQLAEIR